MPLQMLWMLQRKHGDAVAKPTVPDTADFAATDAGDSCI